MKKTPRPQPGIEGIKLYTPGSASGVHMGRKLSSNENLDGPSPRAIAAIRDASAEVWRYPSVDHGELRAAIAGVQELPDANIICGAGSDEILYLIGQAYAGAGDEVIMTQHGFEMYDIIGRSVGAHVIRVPERERTVDVDAILAAISPATKIIFIANPANPTGTMIDEAEVSRLIAGVRDDIIIVLDGAYAEFAEDFDGGAKFVVNNDNVIMTRTFSKLYGLGGMRIGWGFAPQAVIDVLNRIRGPFNLSTPALAAARAAVLDQEYAVASRNRIVANRGYLIGALRQMGLAADDSHANFVLVRFMDEDTATRARVHLAQAGYLVRAVGHYDLPEALRITIGNTEDVHGVVSAFREFMGVDDA